MRRSAGAFAAVAVAVAGCAGPAVSKEGAPLPSERMVLRLGVADPGDDAFDFFVKAVARDSGHRLDLEVDRTTYFSQTAGGEARLAGDLRAGHVDLAYIPSRDWAATGDPDFEALQSPFLVSSTEATVALAQSAEADDVLRGMRSFGAIGLGLVPAQPRRLVTKVPVIGIADLAGARINISDSDQTARLLSALGAQPVQGMADGARTALEGHALDGVESSPRYIGQNSFNVAAPYLTSFAVFGKFEAIAASTTTWSRLSTADRAALKSAAQETVTREAARLAQDEWGDLALLCRNGLVVVQPSASVLHDLTLAAVPADATDPPVKRAIDRLTSAVPALGPRLMASALPPGCDVASTAEQAREMRARSEPSAVPTGSASRAASTIPPGTYRVTVTTQQMRDAGVQGPETDADITYTYVIKPDGTFSETQRPDFPDQGPIFGQYTIAGDQVTFSFDPGPTGSLTPETVRWSFFDGVLTFTVLQVQDQGSRAIYQQPWQKTS